VKFGCGIAGCFCTPEATRTRKRCRSGDPVGARLSLRRCEQAAALRTHSMLRIAFSKCGRTRLPKGVRAIGDLSNSGPNSRSSALMPLLSDGCDTPHRLAARVKLCSLQSARKYRICETSTCLSLGGDRNSAVAG
jgi:hypothetical protein